MGIRVLYCSLMPGWVQAMRLEAETTRLDPMALTGGVATDDFFPAFSYIAWTRLGENTAVVPDHLHLTVARCVDTAPLVKRILREDLFQFALEFFEQTSEPCPLLWLELFRAFQQADEVADLALPFRQRWLFDPHDRDHCQRNHPRILTVTQRFHNVTPISTPTPTKLPRNTQGS